MRKFTQSWRSFTFHHPFVVSFFRVFVIRISCPTPRQGTGLGSMACKKPITKTRKKETTKSVHLHLPLALWYALPPVADVPVSPQSILPSRTNTSIMALV